MRRPINQRQFWKVVQGYYAIFEILHATSLESESCRFFPSFPFHVRGAELDVVLGSPTSALPALQKRHGPGRLMPMVAESEVLGISRYKMCRLKLQTGAWVLYTSRLWLSSALSHFTSMVQQDRAEPISCFRFSRYDETCNFVRLSLGCRAHRQGL